MPNPGSGGATFFDALTGPDGTYLPAVGFTPELVYPDPAADLPLRITPALPAALIGPKVPGPVAPTPAAATPRRTAPAGEPPWPGSVAAASTGSALAATPRPPVPVSYQRRPPTAPARVARTPGRPAASARSNPSATAARARTGRAGRARQRSASGTGWGLQLTIFIVVLIVVAGSSGLFSQLISAIERLIGR